MKKILLLLLLPLVAAASALAQPAPLLTASELQSLLGRADVRVIDIRAGKTAQGVGLYEAGHVPGAVLVPYGKWRGPRDNPGALPGLDDLTATIRGAGLSPDVHAVVVSAGTDSTDFGAAARVYWTLKVAGLKKLSILNGGHKAWVAAGLPVATDKVTVAASQYTPTIDGRLVATRDEVAALVDASRAGERGPGAREGAVRLLDARPRAFFEGETRHQAARVPGTLVGAEHFDNARWFEPGTAVFVSYDEAKRLAAEARLDGGVPTVSFCNTGHWAATNWFALSEVLGEKDVSMYPGSMVEWSGTGLAMANVPGRAKQLWIDASLWWQRTFN